MFLMTTLIFVMYKEQCPYCCENYSTYIYITSAGRLGSIGHSLEQVISTEHSRLGTTELFWKCREVGWLVTQSGELKTPFLTNSQKFPKKVGGGGILGGQPSNTLFYAPQSQHVLSMLLGFFFFIQNVLIKKRCYKKSIFSIGAVQADINY